jgi:uncharacterized membrane protein YukC
MAKSRKKYRQQAREKEQVKRFILTVGIITIVVLVLLYLMFTNM